MGKRQKSQTARKIEYWTRQLTRIAKMLCVVFVIIIIIIAIVWVIPVLIEMVQDII